MKQIVIFPTGTLDAKTKERLSKAGCVAIEATDPSKIVTLIPLSQTSLINSNDLLMCFLKGGLASYSAFERELNARLIANEKKQQQP